MFAHRLICLLLVLGNMIASTSYAQEDSAAISKTAADRFLQLFLKHPQTGTALDKTVEHYQSLGQFDALVEQIKSQARQSQSDPPQAARLWLAAGLVVQSQSRWLESLELLEHAPTVEQPQWELGLAKSLALEQLQRWPEVIEALQPLVELLHTTPDTVKPETVKPETVKPDTVKPDTVKPDTVKPEIVLQAAQRLAKAYSRQGQSDNSLAIWRMLETRFGKDQAIAIRLANMAASEGELEFAIEVLDRILARMTDSTKRVELEIQRAALKARSGDESAAIASYKALLNRVNADSWLAADIARRIEDLIIAKDGIDALIAHYRQQASERPDDLKSQLRLAKLLDSEKQFDEATRIFKRLIERTTSSIETRQAYVQTLIHQGEWHQAAQELERLHALASRDDDILMQWCEAISADPTLDSAARDAQVQLVLEKSIRGTKASPASYQQLANRLQKFGQNDRAIEWLSKAYQLQPDDFSVMADYVRGLVDAGREQPALKILADYRRSHPTQRDDLAQLANLYHDLGQPERAIECLKDACQLGPTAALRFRLADWFEEDARIAEAEEQLEMAWSEVPNQTSIASEQGALCEEIVRRQIALFTRQATLASQVARLQSAREASGTQPSVAGLSAGALSDWRLARFLMEDGQWLAAKQLIDPSLAQNPNSILLWRVQVEIEDQAKRLSESVTALHKLAELDVRRRSEYLLRAAKNLARMGKLNAALNQTETLTTETASSQLIVEVFNLANDYGAHKYASDLLHKRLASRPGDLDVLLRLIAYHVDRGSFQQAANLQWQHLELLRTAEQRVSAVESLINTHYELRSLGELEKKLDKFWRQHDLWREFGVWQAMIAMKNNEYGRAEELFDRLAASQITRRFALENGLKLARQQNKAFKQFTLMKQMSAIEPQSIAVNELVKVLGGVEPEQRPDEMARDALSMVRGSGQRLALVHELLSVAEVDFVLRAIDELSEQEQDSWPIIARMALALAARPSSSDDSLPHVQRARERLDRFIDGSLELPENLQGEPLLADLLGGQEYIVEFIIAASLHRHYASKMQSINSGAQECNSKLRAYQAVIAAQFLQSQSPEQRRAVWERHRSAAMKQAKGNERAVRLAALAIVSTLHAKTPPMDSEVSLLELRGAQLVGGESGFVDSKQRKMSQEFRYSLANGSLQASADLIPTSLALCSESLQNLTLELNELVDQGDSLAALLALWELSRRFRSTNAQGAKAPLESMIKLARSLDEYESFAPSRIVALLVLERGMQDPAELEQYLRALPNMQFSQADRTELIELALAQHNPAMIDLLISSFAERLPVAELLGELISNRGKRDAISSLAALQALDSNWKYEVEHGTRSIEKLELMDSRLNAAWIRRLPLCSLNMHQSSLFKQIDYELMRAIIIQSPSNASRQEILKWLKQQAELPASESLKLVRQLARIFVWELLEQDTQSSNLLDQALPPNNPNPKLAVMRAIWLDVIGRRDAAIEACLALDTWPAEIREGTASILLKIGLDRHDDKAIERAVEQLTQSTTDLWNYRSYAAELLKRGRLADAEALIGEFQVLMPRTTKAFETYQRAITPPVSSYNMNVPAAAQPTGVSLELEKRWVQTDLLFELMNKYSRAAKEEGACRIARRLLAGVRDIGDSEYRNYGMILVARLESGFVSSSQLNAFLAQESQRLQEQFQSKEALCVLRMLARTHGSNQAAPLLAQFASQQLSALESFEVGQCEFQFGNYERAAMLLAQASQSEPDWLELAISEMRTSKAALGLLAKQLNEMSAAGKGVGVQGMDAIFDTIPDKELGAYANLLLDWAGSLRPKSISQIRRVLVRAFREDFQLWIKLVEQMLLAEELQPTTLAYDSVTDWLTPTSKLGAIQSQLMEVNLDAERNAQYRAMLERVLASSRYHFTARLLLFRNTLRDLNTYQTSGDASKRAADSLADQVALLVQSSSTRSPTKGWLMSDWANDLAVQNNGYGSPPAIASRLPATTRSIQPDAIDKAAKIKLLMNLVENCTRGEDLLEVRAKLLEHIIDVGGAGSLGSEHYSDLLRVCATNGNEEKVLELFEQDFRRWRGLPPTTQSSGAAAPSPSPRPALNSKSTTAASSSNDASTWSILAEYRLNWVRHLVLVRAARSEKVPLHKSQFYVGQSVGRISDYTESGTGPIVYPASKLDGKLLLRYVAEAREVLSKINLRGTDVDPWSEAFQPSIVVDYDTRSLRVVSMLDALWPEGAQLSDEETRQQLQREVQDWSQDLGTLGPWSVLGLHNLAARLGDKALVKLAQERLIDIAQSTVKKSGMDWHLASWSAVVASASMPEVAQQRLQLGELARLIASQYAELHETYLLMTLEQMGKLNESGEGTSSVTDLYEALNKDIAKAVARDTRGLVVDPASDAENRLQINVVMFDKLLACGEVQLAMELLICMKNTLGARVVPSFGRISEDDRDHSEVEQREQRTLAALQRLVDASSNPAKLQDMWERFLLDPIPVGQTPADLSDFGIPSNAHRPFGKPAPLQWQEDREVLQPLPALELAPNLFGQLVQLARKNDSLSHLQVRLAQNQKTKLGQIADSHEVCAALVALEQDQVPDALRRYRKLAATNSRDRRQHDFEYVRDSIFNRVRLNPLSDAALEYSESAVLDQLNELSLKLIRQQMSLAAVAKRPEVISKLFNAIAQASELPLAVRQGLRVEAACHLLNLEQIKPSLETYIKLFQKEVNRPREVDRYLLMLMNRLPSLAPHEQTQVFDLFVSRQLPKFPWLECYPVAQVEQLPMRFRDAQTRQGIALAAIDRQAQWLSLLSWIADYAQRTGQTSAAIETATFMALDDVDSGWGAAAINARLNPQLTGAALKNRLAAFMAHATPARMQALLDCAQHNDELRAVAVELILNLGFPDIALAAQGKAHSALQVSAPSVGGQPITTESYGANAWRHWLTLREANFGSTGFERPRWLLAKNGQWSASASNDAWYLMLRYPLEGDFQIGLISRQLSGTKFGIGYGGLSAAQPISDALVRIQAMGGRRTGDQVSLASSESSDVKLEVARRGNHWLVKIGALQVAEQSDDAIPLIFLHNQGPGKASMEDWQIDGELKIAQELDLVDNQLRLWRTSLGQWKLPTVRIQNQYAVLPIKPNEIVVSDRVINLPSTTANETVSNSTLKALHCVRPLMNDETVTYQFYRSDETAIVHVALGRMLFRFEETRVQLQWLTQPQELDWLGIAKNQSIELGPSEMIDKVQFQPNAWNEVQLTRGANNDIAIKLNGREIARVALPPEVIPEIGLIVNEVRPAKVRGLKLTGRWPKSLTLQQLIEQSITSAAK